MTTLNEHLTSARGYIRPDEAFLTRVLSHIPEKKQPRGLLSPYVTYFLTTCVSVYALFVVAMPVYRDYQLYRVENDVDLMTIDEVGDQQDQAINAMEEKDMNTAE